MIGQEARDQRPAARGAGPPGARQPVLLDRLRGGDQQAAAEFFLSNADKIRRRLRGRLSQGLQRVFDLDDLLSTVSRRFHELVVKGTLTASSEAELWVLVDRLARNAASDYADRLRKQRLGESRGALPALDPAGEGPTVEPKPEPGRLQSAVERCAAKLQDQIDDELLRMRLDGHTHTQIAARMGVSVGAVRKRWQRIRRTILRRL